MEAFTNVTKLVKAFGRRSLDLKKYGSVYTLVPKSKASKLTKFVHKSPQLFRNTALGKMLVLNECKESIMSS